MLFQVFSREIFFFDIPSASFRIFPGSSRILFQRVRAFFISRANFSLIFAPKQFLTFSTRFSFSKGSLKFSFEEFFKAPAGSALGEEDSFDPETSSVAWTTSSSSSAGTAVLSSPAVFFSSAFDVSATVSKGISCCSFSVKTDTSVFLISESFSDSTGVFSNSAKTGSVSDFVFCSSSSSGGHNLTSNSLNHSTRPDTSACS